MVTIKRKAPTGQSPIDANTAKGIQSKAVTKYTEILPQIISYNIEIIFCGWEAVLS